MTFEDLSLQSAGILTGRYINVTLGVNFRFPYTLIDSDGSLMDFSSGYTAEMTLNLANGSNVTTFTNVSTGGRVIDLNPSEDATLVIRSTPAGLAPLEPFVGRSLVFNLVVRRSSDGYLVDVMRNCFLVPFPAND